MHTLLPTAVGENDAILSQVDVWRGSSTLLCGGGLTKWVPQGAVQPFWPPCCAATWMGAPGAPGPGLSGVLEAAQAQRTGAGLLQQSVFIFDLASFCS